MFNSFRDVWNCSFNKKNNISKFTNTSFYNSPSLPKKHNHVEIHFKGLRVIYNDPRRFGFFKFIENKKELENRFSHLGPEPFFKNFNLEYLIGYFTNKKKDIKSFLLDQKFVSGIGNIYASEILFLCKINPITYASKLTKQDCKKLLLIQKVYLIGLLKKEGQVFEILKTSLEKVEISKKNLGFIKEKI